jgi:hypothetical protein
MENYIQIYDLCREKISESEKKYGIYVHNYCANRYIDQHLDKFKCVATLDELATEIINNMELIFKNAYTTVKSIMLSSKMSTYSMNCICSKNGTLEDKIYHGKKFQGTIFSFNNINRDYQYSINIFELEKNEFFHVIGIVKKHFGLDDDMQNH